MKQDRKTTALMQRALSDDSIGGVTREDIVIPRVILLQGMTPDLPTYLPLGPGDIVSSITKEEMSGTFIPLFPFKLYAQFDADRKMLWATMDRNDVRVAPGLVWGEMPDGRRFTQVTEMLNFVVCFNDELEAPYILSFKRSSLPVGRRFLTLLHLRKNRSDVPECYANRYVLSSREAHNKRGTYYAPFIDSPKDSSLSKVPPELVEEARKQAEHYHAIITRAGMAADTVDDDAIE